MNQISRQPNRLPSGPGSARRSAKPRKDVRRVVGFETLEERHTLSGFAAHFDFGTATSPVEQNFTRVSDRTTYSPAHGYGWTSGKIFSGDRGGKNSALTRDFNHTKDGTFAVDVPSGHYQVDMILGDVGSYAHDLVGIFIEGLAVDTVTTKAKQVVSRRYEVDVTDSQFQLRIRDLGGKDVYGVIESLELASLGPVVPKLTVSDVKLLEGTGASREIVFDVKLSVPSEQDVSVFFETSHGTAGSDDYDRTAGTLTIPAGTTSSTISTRVHGDEYFEGDESFNLDLSNPIGVNLAKTRAIGTIQNDDQPWTLAVTVTPDSFLENTPGTAATGTLLRKGATSKAIIVNLTSSDESEVRVPDTVEIPAGQESVTFSILAVDDLETDGSRTVRITATADHFSTGQATVRVRDDERPQINGSFSNPYRDSEGFTSYVVHSSYQRSSNTIRVLLPNNYDPTKSYRVVYVLPVEKGNSRQFGDGLVTARNHGLQNTYGAIFVAPSFSDTPWFADHAWNSKIWQETYFRKVVVPFVDDQYGIDPRPENRLLLGFSKSGYGAVSMLLRYPETFGRAATWDSPLTMNNPKSAFGFLEVLGSYQNFSQNYQVTSLIANRGSALAIGTTPRIIMLGYSKSYPYYRDHASVSAQLTQLHIPHIHSTGVLRAHVWGSGWMADIAKHLLT